MTLNFRKLVDYHQCPASYKLWGEVRLRGVLERWRHFRQAIGVYHSPPCGKAPLEMAIEFLHEIREKIKDPQVRGMYTKAVEWLRLYDLLQSGSSRKVKPKGRLLTRPVSGLDITLPAVLTETLTKEHIGLWVFDSGSVPRDPTSLPSTFKGQLVASIVRGAKPMVGQVSVYYHKHGVVRDLDTTLVPVDLEFEATLKRTVEALRRDTTFSPNPGPHCSSCFHRRSGKCHSDWWRFLPDASD